jgi:hypothetical protein
MERPSRLGTEDVARLPGVPKGESVLPMASQERHQLRVDIYAPGCSGFDGDTLCGSILRWRRAIRLWAFVSTRIVST